MSDYIPPSVRQKYNNLELLMCQQFGWTRARKIQIEGTLLQLARLDALIHSGTGTGKTAIVAGPYVLDENSERLTIFISPLIALQAEMEMMFPIKYKTPAVAINSLIGPDLTKVIKDILVHKYRVLLISPESLLSHRIRDELLAKKAFKDMVLSVVIDEVHVIAYWGPEFRKKYGALHVVRDYLPGIPVLGLSATLTPRVIEEVAMSLDMKEGKYVFINEGNERPELSFVVRQCKYPLNSFHDLQFLFKKRPLFHPLDIPKTFIYIDNKAEGEQALQALNKFLPPHLACLGLIRPFNARHCSQCRADTMDRFRRGDIRILICTDAAGMGCDVDGIEISIQWRVVSLSSLIQRWGRAARGEGEIGICYLFVEKSAYDSNPTEPGTSRFMGSRNALTGPKPKPTSKDVLKKGGWKPTQPGDDYPPLRADSPYEGTLALVQAVGCIRKLCTRIFRNNPMAPLGQCCSAQCCAPELHGKAEVTEPYQSARSRPKGKKRGLPHPATRLELGSWRMKIWDRDHAESTWGPSALLSNELINLLSSVGQISTYSELESLVAEKWGLWDTYGKELSEFISTLNIPSIPVPPKSPAQPKRKAPIAEPAPKRSRNNPRQPPPNRPPGRAASNAQSGATSTALSADPTRRATHPTLVAPRLAASPGTPPPRVASSSAPALPPMPWRPVQYPLPNLPRRPPAIAAPSRVHATAEFTSPHVMGTAPSTAQGSSSQIHQKSPASV